MVITTVRSETEVGKRYNISFGADGNMWCNCYSWIHQARPVTKRTCKHLIKFVKELGRQHSTLEQRHPNKMRLRRQRNEWVAA